VRVDQQIGLEKTPDEYVAGLVSVFREVRRVLADDGTLWLNIGDSYAANTKGSGGTGKGTIARGAGQATNAGSFYNSRFDLAASNVKPKDLVGIPWRVAFALQADGWWLRQDIIWSKPNPMPESVTDRCTKAHEYLFLLTKSATYYYDASAIAEDLAPASRGRYNYAFGGAKTRALIAANKVGVGQRTRVEGTRSTPTTRNRRSVWHLPTKPFRGAHFAVMPEALVEPCILAGTAPDDIVLDPFAGSGTVGVVALRYARSFIGIDLKSEYADMARCRILENHEWVDIPTLFDETGASE